MAQQITGIITSAMNAQPETEAERTQREADKLNKWMNDNPDIVSHLEKLPKEILVLFLCVKLGQEDKLKQSRKILVDEWMAASDELEKYSKILKSNEGRHRGGVATRAKADAHKNLIKTVVTDLLMKPEKSGMTDGAIAKYLMHSTRMLHMHNGIARSERTMIRYVHKIREEYKATNRLAG